MKVILLTEVQGKGGEGDVVEVARGFFNNYLGPQKKAVLATAGNLKQLEQRRGNIAKREEKRIADAEALKASLEGKKIFVDAKVGEEGVETALAGAAGDEAELASESADLIYHLLVLLHARNMVFQDVLDVLARRAQPAKDDS